ncbi:MAG: right-handed parallel beta-helix repeat-containing protein [Desulfuromonadaceae bacterium]|nr:right-handed parallel beta-helix repeat-containing protein [Desulfuromonadaceae bacterium]
MKALCAVCIFFCLISVACAAEQAPMVYDRAVLTEDTTWRGFILVKDFVIVAPQATLRISPGTMVRFVASSRQLPNLVVQGRIHAAGTSEQPIVLRSDTSRSTGGSWGGVVLLSTEKRNLLEHCRIENPETGIDVRFSTITMKSVFISTAQTALLSHDGVIQLTGGTISDSGTGIELYNSEFDGRDTTISSCARGCVASKSALVLSSVTISGNQQSGLESEECRLKITGGNFSENTRGARIRGGEGQVFMTRFQKNRETALHISGSRIKIQRCLFSDNSQDALRTEDGRSLLTDNAFSSNGGFNVFNAGREVVSARQNWWGTTDPSRISKGISDAALDAKSGTVQVFPWLNEKPQLVP